MNGGLHFEARQFHYADRSCRRALYSVSSRGRAKPEQPSFLVPGATELDVAVDSVSLTPYRHSTARSLQRRYTMVAVTTTRIVKSIARRTYALENLGGRGRQAIEDGLLC